ncbi:5494_t:CDS:1, partial [Racocetra fulgida]
FKMRRHQRNLTPKRHDIRETAAPKNNKSEKARDDDTSETMRQHITKRRLQRDMTPEK